MMNREQKEVSPTLNSSAVNVPDSINFPICHSSSLSSSSASGEDGNERSRSNSGDTDSGSLVDQLYLQVPVQHNPHHQPHSISTGSNSSQQSSPRPSTTTIEKIPTRSRGNSSSSSISIGEISDHRDLSDIRDEFKIVKILHDGAFSKVLLAQRDIASSDSEESNDDRGGVRKASDGPNVHNRYLILKAIPSGGLYTEEFKRELRYNYFLSPHPNIVTSFNISFNWASCFNVFVQEYAPFGDLSRYLQFHSSSNSVSSTVFASPIRKPLPESQVKSIASQLASALEFMHSCKLVHQDVRAENVLVFKPNMSRVKLCDFGCTQKENTLMTKASLISASSLYHSSLLAPELSYLLPQEKYESHRSADVWQMGILICVCLTGKYPWENAEFSDPKFQQYTSWLKRKCLRVPEPFKRFTPRLVRLLKRLLEPKQNLRSEIREVFKYLKDDWIKPNCGNRTILLTGNHVNCSGSSIGTISNKNAVGALPLHPLHKKRELRNRNEVAGAATGNKISNKLIILTSNGINLLENHSPAPCGSNRSSTSKSYKNAAEKLSDDCNSNNKVKENQNGDRHVYRNGVVEGKQKKDNQIIEAGQVDEAEDEGDGNDIMTKRVEKWVASAARRSAVSNTTAVVLQRGSESRENSVKRVEAENEDDIGKDSMQGLEEK